MLNYSHILPTRYTFADVDTTKLVPKNSLRDPARKRKAIRRLKHKFVELYRGGEKKWFFTKLQF